MLGMQRIHRGRKVLDKIHNSYDDGKYIHDTRIFNNYLDNLYIINKLVGGKTMGEPDTTNQFAITALIIFVVVLSILVLFLIYSWTFGAK